MRDAQFCTEMARPGRFELSPPDDAIGLPIGRDKAEQQPRTRSVTPAHPDLICPTRQVRCRARSECMRVMRKLPVVPICRNPSALPLPPNQRQISRRPVLDKRGVSRSSRTLGAGCDGRGSDARRAALLRTAKSCGPDAPTLASSLQVVTCRRRWQKSPVTGESTK
jgi:hypothetical protein